jgi:hypothetical protein
MIADFWMLLAGKPKRCVIAMRLCEEAILYPGNVPNQIQDCFAEPCNDALLILGAERLRLKTGYNERETR